MVLRWTEPSIHVYRIFPDYKLNFFWKERKGLKSKINQKDL